MVRRLAGTARPLGRSGIHTGRRPATRDCCWRFNSSGRGTVAGPVIGAILFISANEFFVAWFGATELNIVATGLLLVLVLMFFPEGILGTLKQKGRLPKILDWD